MGRDDILIHMGLRPCPSQPHIRVRGEMIHDFRVAEDRSEIAAQDVAFHELRTPTHGNLHVGPSTGSQSIEEDNVDLVDQGLRKVATDKAGPSRNHGSGIAHADPRRQRTTP